MTTLAALKQQHGIDTHGRYGAPVMVRLLRKIEEQPDGCWLWTGSLCRKGYGSIRLTQALSPRTHRLMYEALVGPIPDGLTVDHLCRQKLCQNVAHMELVTAGENARRASAHRAERTECRRGHAFDEANTYVDTQGARHCRACVAAAPSRNELHRRRATRRSA